MSAVPRLVLAAAAAGGTVAAAILDAFLPIGWFGVGWAWACESDSAPHPCGPPDPLGGLAFVLAPVMAALAVLAVGDRPRGIKPWLLAAAVGVCILAPNAWFAAKYGVDGF